MFLRLSSALLLTGVCLLLLISRQWPDKAVQLIFCDVGQGDAALIVDGFYQVLIDGGPEEKVLSCLEKYVPFWDKQLEVVVATHPDLDHIGGLQHVLERFQVDSFYFIPGSMDSKSAQVFQDTAFKRVKSGLTRLIIPKIKNKYVFTERVWIEVINPVIPSSLDNKCFFSVTETWLWDTYECFDYAKINKNELSIALNMHINATTVFFSADIGIPTELSLKEQGMLQDVDILKVGHHGSKSSTSRELLEVLLPETSVISVGRNNKYNHPFPQVLQQLEAIGSTIMRTDTLGNIEFLVFDDYYSVKLPI